MYRICRRELPDSRHKSEGKVVFIRRNQNSLSPSSESRIKKLFGLPFFCSSVRKFPSQFLIRQKEKRKGALTAKTEGDPGRQY